MLTLGKHSLIVIIIVQQDESWLTNDAKTEPEIDVAHLRVLREQATEPNHGHLQEHAKEEPQLERVQRDTDDDFVEDSRHEEDEGSSEVFVDTSAHARVVQVTQQPVMHGQVPVAPITIESRGVPPVLVEFSITKFEQFSEDI
jgi:hypothetical protein